MCELYRTLLLYTNQEGWFCCCFPWFQVPDSAMDFFTAVKGWGLVSRPGSIGRDSSTDSCGSPQLGAVCLDRRCRRLERLTIWERLLPRAERSVCVCNSIPPTDTLAAFWRQSHSPQPKRHIRNTATYFCSTDGLNG